MSDSVRLTVPLIFPLEVEDEWPPFAVESLPFEEGPGGYIATVPPLFIRNISVGDIIAIRLEPGSRKVEWWHHVKKSKHTTVWLLRLKQSKSIDTVLAKLRALGCSTVGLDEVGVYSVDIPETVPIEFVDSALAHLDQTAVATAFPSMRHED